MFDIGKAELTAETRKGLPGEFVELSAGVTNYDLRGDPGGKTVVLIHGNAAPSATWDHTIDPLCEAGLRVLRYDLFGHGFSDRPKLRRYPTRLYNTQLAELLDALEIPYPILVVGTSQGGSIGTCFAAEYQGKVERLALLSPLFDTFEGSRSAVARLVKVPVVGDLLLQLVKDEKMTDLSAAIESPERRAALEEKVAEQFRFRGKRRAILANWRGDALQDATSRYRNVGGQGIPILLTWGTLDQSIPGASMRRLRDLIPAIEYHEFEGVRHLAHYEFPELVNPPLIRFLTR